MVSRLREREHIRDPFERHVGEDVARDALDREVGLGGELRQVELRAAPPTLVARPVG